jgi:hypothetical protein
MSMVRMLRAAPPDYGCGGRHLAAAPPRFGGRIMNGKFTCDDTQTLLDRLSEGTLTGDERRALRAHARICPDCAMLVRIHEHCARPAADDLEAAVPGEMAEGMWRRIEARIAERPGRHAVRPPASERHAVMDADRRGRAARPPAAHSPRLEWWRRGLVPGLVAAVFILAFACGFLFGELRELRQREGALVAELASGRQAFDRSHFHERVAPRGHVAGVLADLGWRHALPARESYSIEELVALLERLPPRTSLLPAGDGLAYLGGAFRMRGVGGCTRRALVDMHDGLQAGEAVRLAKCLRIEPGTRISREELVTLIESIIGKGARS